MVFFESKTYFNFFRNLSVESLKPVGLRIVFRKVAGLINFTLLCSS